MLRASLVLLVLGGSLQAADPPTGFQMRTEVKKTTRLDWEFVAVGFGKDALKLPADYDSRQQRFQLFVPRTYKADRAWPLILFISPGDAPMGWRYWQKPCEQDGYLYCEAYGAGNSCPAGKRIRIVLDVFDQVRRDYRLDPDRTYVTGFSGGGRMACTIGYNLPEFVGGIIPVCGTNPLPSLDYLRHRVQDRLSVALVTGETDFNRAENEKYMAPFLVDLSVRSRLWVVPKLGHGVPGDAVLSEVLRWLEEDLPRRREDVKKRPLLASPPDEAMIPSALASRLLEQAEIELKDDKRLWRGVTLLQAVLARYPRTESGTKARKLLDALKEDGKKLEAAGEQGGQEERTYLKAQAQALERLGQTAKALEAWKLLAEQHPFSEEGRKALVEVRRLTGVVAATPYLGIGLAGESATVDRVAPGGPADRAGVQTGDRLRQFNDTRINSLSDLRRALETVKPGDKVKLLVERKGKMLTLMVDVSGPPEKK